MTPERLDDMPTQCPDCGEPSLFGIPFCFRFADPVAGETLQRFAVIRFNCGGMWDRDDAGKWKMWKPCDKEKV